MNRGEKSGAVCLLVSIFEDSLSDITVRFLRDRGFEVYEASDIDEAFGFMLGHDVDVFLLDAAMPQGESGLKWAESYHSELRATGAMVLLLSSVAPTDEDREKEADLPGVFFIPRPKSNVATQEALVRHLDRALELTGRHANAEASGSDEPDTGEPVPSRSKENRRIGEPGGGFAYRFQPVPTRGSLEDISFLELLCDSYAEGFSGRLHVHRGPVEKQIYMLGGYPFYVRSNQPEETLLEEIRREELLDQRSLAFMQTKMRHSSLRASQILVENNLINSDNLHSLLTETFTSRLGSLFSWEDGGFWFDTNDQFGDRDYSFSLAPARIIIDGVLHEVDDQLLSLCVPQDPDLRPYGRDNGLWVSGEFQLSKLEIKIAKQLRAGKSVTEIAEETGELLFFVQRLLTGFFMLGMIGFKPPAPANRPVGSKPSIQPPPVDVTPRPQAAPRLGQIITELSRIAGVDYFAMLEIDPDGAQQEVHKAFREKIKPYRAELLSQLSETERAASEEVVKHLTEAYMVLSNAEHRKLYKADIENPERTPEDAALLARERRQGVQLSPIPGSPVSRWNMTPVPESPVPQRVVLTPTAPPPHLTAPLAEQAGRPIGSPSAIPSRPPPAANSRDAESLLDEAKSALDEADLQRALSLLTLALEKKPGDPTLVAWHAWALFSKDPHGTAYEAITLLEKARKTAPRLPDIHLLLARILEFQGEYDVAMKHYRVVDGSSNVPPAYRREARAFDVRMKEAKVRQKESPRKDIVEILNEDVGNLFRHYVLGDKKDEKK